MCDLDEEIERLCDEAAEVAEKAAEELARCFEKGICPECRGHLNGPVFSGGFGVINKCGRWCDNCGYQSWPRSYNEGL